MTDVSAQARAPSVVTAPIVIRSGSPAKEAHDQNSGGSGMGSSTGFSSSTSNTAKGMTGRSAAQDQSNQSVQDPNNPGITGFVNKGGPSLAPGSPSGSPQSIPGAPNPSGMQGPLSDAIGSVLGSIFGKGEPSMTPAQRVDTAFNTVGGSNVGFSPFDAPTGPMASPSDINSTFAAFKGGRGSSPDLSLIGGPQGGFPGAQSSFQDRFGGIQGGIEGAKGVTSVAPSVPSAPSGFQSPATVNLGLPSRVDTAFNDVKGSMRGFSPQVQSLPNNPEPIDPFQDRFVGFNPSRVQTQSFPFPGGVPDIQGFPGFRGAPQSAPEPSRSPTQVGPGTVGAPSFNPTSPTSREAAANPSFNPGVTRGPGVSPIGFDPNSGQLSDTGNFIPQILAGRGFNAPSPQLESLSRALQDNGGVFLPGRINTFGPGGRI